MYPATSTLSVDASQLTVALVSVMSVTVTPDGTVGASISFAFSVVKVAASDLADSFPAASTAVTVTVYSVSSASPVRSYSVPVTSSSFTLLSFTYTLYPTTPTLSLASSHVTFAVVSVTSVAVTAAGAVGASVSAAALST